MLRIRFWALTFHNPMFHSAVPFFYSHFKKDFSRSPPEPPTYLDKVRVRHDKSSRLDELCSWTLSNCDILGLLVQNFAVLYLCELYHNHNRKPLEGPRFEWIKIQNSGFFISPQPDIGV